MVDGWVGLVPKVLSLARWIARLWNLGQITFWVRDLCLTSLILVITWLKLDPSLIVWLLVGGWLGWSPRAWNPFLSIWTCVCLFSIFATTEIKTWPPDLTWFELITSKGCLWPSFYLLICNKSSCSYCLLVFVCFVGILACPLVGLFKFSV